MLRICLEPLVERKILAAGTQLRQLPMTYFSSSLIWALSLVPSELPVSVGAFSLKPLSAGVFSEAEASTGWALDFFFLEDLDSDLTTGFWVATVAIGAGHDLTMRWADI